MNKFANRKRYIPKAALKKDLSKIKSEMGYILKSQVMSVIDKQEEAILPEWIPVTKDTLPEENQMVLAYSTVKQMDSDQNIIYTQFKYQDCWFDGSITHWMPSPYKPITKGDL